MRHFAMPVVLPSSYLVYMSPAVETVGAVGQQQGTVHIEEGSERIEQYEWIKGLGLRLTWKSKVGWVT